MGSRARRGGYGRRMVLLCAECVSIGEHVEALSVTGGEAVCGRHFARSLINPALSDAEKVEHVRRTLTRERFPAVPD